MINFILASLLAALVYLLWRADRHENPGNPGPRSGKVAVWVLIGLLSLFALLSPGIRDKINELRQKYHL